MYAKKGDEYASKIHKFLLALVRLRFGVRLDGVDAALRVCRYVRLHLRQAHQNYYYLHCKWGVLSRWLICQIVL